MCEYLVVLHHFSVNLFFFFGGGHLQYTTVLYHDKTFLSSSYTSTFKLGKIQPCKPESTENCPTMTGFKPMTSQMEGGCVINYTFSRDCTSVP